MKTMNNGQSRVTSSDELVEGLLFVVATFVITVGALATCVARALG
jgi:hypothetical protein